MQNNTLISAAQVAEIEAAARLRGYYTDEEIALVSPFYAAKIGEPVPGYAEPLPAPRRTREERLAWRDAGMAGRRAAQQRGE